MIDTKELRRLAQAAAPGPDGVSLSWIKLLQDFQQGANPAVINELLDRLEEAESDALEQARLNGMGASREATLMAKLEAAEKSDAESIAMYRKARGERDAMRARIEAMEKQEPVAWGAFYFGGKLNGKLYSHCDTEAQIDKYIEDRHRSDDSNTFRKAALYALPGAKGEESTPNIPESTQERVWVEGV